MKPRIAIFTNKVLDGVSLWRSIRPWTDLYRAGLVDIKFFYQEIQEQEFYNFDVLYICHAHHHNFLKLIEGAHLAGCLVWVDVDDSLADVPVHNQKAHTIREGAESFKRILNAGDIFSVSTAELQEEVGKWMKNDPVVLPNCVHLSELSDTWNPGKNVLWRGNFSQLRDMWVNVRDQERLYKAGFSFAYIGVPPPWVENPEWLEWGPAHAYFSTLRKTKAAFFWKPLEDVAFNHSKSNITMLEGAMVGGLTITNLKTEKWKPALSVEQAIDNADTWKEKRYAQMLEFIGEHYNAQKVNADRYTHLINSLT